MSLKEQAELALIQEAELEQQLKDRAILANSNRAKEIVEKALGWEGICVYAHDGAHHDGAGSVIQIDDPDGGDPVYVKVLKNYSNTLKRRVFVLVEYDGGTDRWGAPVYQGVGATWQWDSKAHAFTDRVGFSRALLSLLMIREIANRRWVNPQDQMELRTSVLDYNLKHCTCVGCSMSKK